VLAGYRVQAWSRGLEGAPAAARSLATGVHGVAELEPALRGARALVFCVRDAAIAELALRVAGLVGSDGPAVALHTSGFFGPERLAPLARRAVATGVLHPLTALPRDAGRAADEPPRLRGVWFATSGAPAARALARVLVAALGGHELALAPGADAQACYHAAATLLSNGLVALFDAAQAVGARASPDTHALHAALATLLAATSANLQRSTPQAALTGPIARGDVDVVRGHLELLARLPDASALAAYRVLGRRLVELARSAGGLAAGQLDELERLLGD
jgi:predicted short-subunit dehydrogenase-like oxidoreductase (DUF2520 family)